MKNKQLLLSLLIALVFSGSALVISSGYSMAAVRKDISEYAGKRCNTPPAGSGVIVGFFIGTEEGFFGNQNDSRVSVNRYRCFSSAEECQGWMYTMQSKYTSAGPATVARCFRR